MIFPGGSCRKSGVMTFERHVIKKRVYDFGLRVIIRTELPLKDPQAT